MIKTTNIKNGTTTCFYRERILLNQQNNNLLGNKCYSSLEIMWLVIQYIIRYGIDTLIPLSRYRQPTLLLLQVNQDYIYHVRTLFALYQKRAKINFFIPKNY